MAIAPIGIRIARNTEENWATNNPTLGLGQPGYETDTFKLKVGDGASDWNSLSYVAAESAGGDGWALTGTSTLTGNVFINANGNNLTFNNIEFFALESTDSINIGSQNANVFVSSENAGVVINGAGIVELISDNSITATPAAEFTVTAGSAISAYSGEAGIYIESSTGSINLDFDTTGVLIINGDIGTTGYVLTSSGPGAPPTWSPAGGGTTYTFENGLNELSGIVKLGGDLLQHTTLSGGYNFTFADLTGFSVVTSDGSGSTGIQLINPAGSGGFQIYHGAAADFQIVSSGSATSFDIGHYGSGTMTITDGSPSNFIIQKNAGSGGAFMIQKNGGSDPFTIANNGDGDMIIEKNSSDGVFEITQNGSGGLQIKNTGEGGISIENDNIGLINIVSGGGIVVENISDGPTNIINTSDAGDLTIKGQTADTTKQFSIVINGNYGIVVDDTDAQHGLKYQSDYSATYDDRSLVDKAYVDSVAVGSGGGFNGTAGYSSFLVNSSSTTQPILNLNNGDLSTGDAFIRIGVNTARSYAIGVDNSSSDVLKITSANSNSATLDSTLIASYTSGQITLNPPTVFNSGIYAYSTLYAYNTWEYTSDFSSSYTNRSLVDKEYVDSAVGGAGFTTIDTITSYTNASDSMQGKVLLLDTSSYSLTLNLSNGLSNGLEFDVIVHGSNSASISADNVFYNSANPSGTSSQNFFPGARLKVLNIGSNAWFVNEI